MKTVGLIGGMSWESTVPYYRLINETVKKRLGGLHSAKIVLYSVDFHDIERLQQTGDWPAAGALLAGAARSLEAAGADFLVLCTNTMHKVADHIEAAVAIPLLHIVDPTAAAIKGAGHTTVGLLGTRFTMEQAFYRERLIERHGLQVLVPEAADREAIHRIIFEELCLGVVRPESRSLYRNIMAKLAAQGAEAIILGCTEISLLVSQADAEVPLFDTTALHAQAAAEWALAASPLDRWHQLVQARSPKGLGELLSEQVIFHSPVVHTPQAGKAITTQYLTAALQVFFNESFRYTREVVGARDAVLEFQVEIEGISVNGVDMLRWDDHGKIVEFKVMLRPLKAINLIHAKMAALLQASRST
jgi:aspartate racemase